ncbi:C2H2-type zinc finger protein [Endozoicomonas euniceicola]|uniref:C2H2-type zinc finger protein n=1 Tax=Endozoicomonas euniceicola TaxID=1234143 RepID=UPI00384C1661
MRSHTGAKPLQCPFCFKAFASERNFIRHKRIHTGEKPYECEICNKRFSDKSNFNRHKQSHTGNKPFRCPNCDKSYTSAINLTAHRKKHHSNQGTSAVTTVHSQVEPTGIVMTTTQTIASLSSVTAISNIVSSHGTACSVNRYAPAATFSTVFQEGEQTVK